MDHVCAPLMQWYAVSVTYRGAVSTCGTLAYSIPLPSSPSLALCGWRRWCESRQMGLAARQQATSVTGLSSLAPVYPCVPPSILFSSTSSHCPVFSVSVFCTLSSPASHPPFATFYPRHLISKCFFPPISLPLPLFHLLPSPSPFFLPDAIMASC